MASLIMGYADERLPAKKNRRQHRQSPSHKVVCAMTAQCEEQALPRNVIAAMWNIAETVISAIGKCTNNG